MQTAVYLDVDFKTRIIRLQHSQSATKVTARPATFLLLNRSAMPPGCYVMRLGTTGGEGSLSSPDPLGGGCPVSSPPFVQELTALAS